MLSGDLNTRSSSVDLIHTNGTHLCSLPDLPAQRWGHTQNGLVICGGTDCCVDTRKSCVTFSSGTWQETHTLRKERRHHTSWTSPQGVVMIGGYESGMQTTTELLNDNGGSTYSFSLDYITTYDL